jgi:hypothetical protein
MINLQKSISNGTPYSMVDSCASRRQKKNSKYFYNYIHSEKKIKKYLYQRNFINFIPKKNLFFPQTKVSTPCPVTVGSSSSHKSKALGSRKGGFEERSTHLVGNRRRRGLNGF